jgi:hypothetical protein
MTTRHRRNPSNIAHFLFHDSEELLHYLASETAAAALLDHDIHRNAPMQAIPESRCRWEKEASTRLIKDRSHVTPSPVLAGMGRKTTTAVPR